VRLWKLHGSVNWEEETKSGRRHVVRLGSPAPKGAVAAIYPSDEKYDQSRRVPFVVLMDRFRRALEMPETFTLINGYSFGDQHLNEMMFDAARAHPRSETAVLCFDSIPGEVAAVAIGVRNLLVLAATEAIIGGRRLPWAHDGDVPGVWEDKKFLLGDFAKLAPFLATKARLDDAGT
jgi:SIR2-like protein